MEYVSSSKVAGDTPVGKGAYTNFLDAAGGVQADLTVLRLAEDRFRVIDGGDAGNRDATYLRRMTQRSEEHTSELQSLMRISYAVFCLKKTNIAHHTQKLTNE